MRTFVYFGGALLLASIVAVCTYLPAPIAFALAVTATIAWIRRLEGRDSDRNGPSRLNTPVFASLAAGAALAALPTLAQAQAQTSPQPQSQAQSQESQSPAQSQSQQGASSQDQTPPAPQSSSLATAAATATPTTATATTAAAATSATATPATASDSPSGEWWRDVNFGAAFEGYYQYNGNRPPDRVNVLRAYDTRANMFSIQQAAIVIDAAPDVAKNRRFGVRVDFQFGQATETVQGGAANEPRPDVYRNVWQAFGSYIFPVGRGLRVDFGKFASNLGYETNYAKDNQAFSRAYLFNFLPFYHSGVRATLPVNDKLTVMYAVTNGIQQTEDFNNFKSQQISATLTPTKRITATVNGYFGQEQPDNGEPDGPNGRFSVLDAYVAWTATDALTLGVDLNRTTNQLVKGDPTLALTGVAGYARYQVTAPLAFGLRYEHLDDEGLFGGAAQTLQEVTFTTEYKLADGFLVRGEYRRDWSNLDFFPGSRPEQKRRAQNTVLAGLVWWIGNKQGAW